PADGGTKLEDICAFCHPDSDPDGGLAFLPHLKIRRVDIAMVYRRNIAKTKYAAVRLNRGFGHSPDAVEGAGDAQRNALRRRVHGACRHHRILPCKRLEYLVGCN